MKLLIIEGCSTAVYKEFFQQLNINSSLRQAHIVAADNRRKATNEEIAYLWRQSDGKRGMNKICWRVETTMNDNTTA